MKRYNKLTRFIGFLIWNISEDCHIGLGRFAPTVFGMMMGVKGVRVEVSTTD